MYIAQKLHSIYIVNPIPLQSRDATRSLASSSTTNKHRRPLSSTAAPGSGSAVTASGSGAVIASLRGKVHSLERVLREKESALASLKREVSATRLREMEVQCEAYYREITRYVCVAGREGVWCVVAYLCCVREKYGREGLWGGSMWANQALILNIIMLLKSY